jgi:hypothetical protein
MPLNVNLSLASFVRGSDGNTPVVGPNGNWWVEGVDTGIRARGSDGSGAYEIAVEQGFQGSEQEFNEALTKIGKLVFYERSEWERLSLAEQAIPEWAIIYEDEQT